jgi:hypothetical protein
LGKSTSELARISADYPVVQHAHFFSFQQIFPILVFLLFKCATPLGKKYRGCALALLCNLGHYETTLNINTNEISNNLHILTCYLYSTSSHQQDQVLHGQQIGANGDHYFSVLKIYLVY